VILQATQVPRPDSAIFSALNWTPAELAQGLITSLVILLGSFIAYRLIKLLVKRIVSHQVETEDPIVKRLREQRAQTLGSLLQNVSLVAIIIVALLTILQSLGLQISPLLAGFGVIGLAVSFGAQSLVKDVITGTFILIEGQFGIGDVVRVDSTEGQVEKITLRTTTLRDFEGVVHIIPNGEITKVSNLTKTWSRAVLDVAVAYREDIDRVMDVLGQIGAAFQADPEWGPLLLDDPEVLGVQGFGAGTTIRMQVKTLPLKQWAVARELRRRIKNRFDHDDIRVPLPHMTFFWGDRTVPSDNEPISGASSERKS
jgi:small conductance mechanosensitive channel